MRKTWMGGAIGVGLATVVGVTTVFACTSLATLNLSQASAPSGTNLTVTGSSFGSTTSGNSAVTLHWNSISGPVLAQGIVPDQSGAIGPVSITVPQSATPGYYTIIATQTDKSGQNSFGTPARAAIQVTGAAGAPAGSGSSQPVASPTSNGSGLGAGLIGLLVALGVGGLILFGLGTATFVGSYRRVPSASKVRKQ
ncbi:MAG TPA: hypothetical protein VF155_06430 [Candidatus Dormibacteraeota bacterium]